MPPFQPATSEPRDAAHEWANTHIGIVVSRWYPEITKRLEAAAVATALAAGITESQFIRAEVPGAFELPQAAGWLARGEGVDAVVALGCIVRGETSHFDHVARACVDGLSRVASESGIPVGLGVITAETLAQAEARSSDKRGKGGKGGNKGVEAMEAALDMIKLYRDLERKRRAT